MNGDMRLVDNIVLDGGNESSIDAEQYADQRCTQTGHRCNVPLADGRLIPGNWLPFVRFGKAESLNISQANV